MSGRVMQYVNSVLYLSDTIENPVVPLLFRPGMDETYSLRFKFEATQFETILLEDILLHHIQDLKVDSIYSFKATKKDNQSRFALHFAPFENNIKIESPINIYRNGDLLIIDLTNTRGESEIMVCDIMGRLVLQKKLEGETLHSINIKTSPQMLIVNLKNQKVLVNKKIMWVN